MFFLFNNVFLDINFRSKLEGKSIVHRIFLASDMTRIIHIPYGSVYLEICSDSQI